MEGVRFSPLLILFMVKLMTANSLMNMGFSPLLILFMVKSALFPKKE